MIRSLTWCSLLVRSPLLKHHHPSRRHNFIIMSRSSMKRVHMSTMVNDVDSVLLAKDWSKHLLSSGDNPELYNDNANKNNMMNDAIVNAAKRSLPLLEEGPLTVPFVCRYRTDVIHPLNTKQVHLLCHLIGKHKSLGTLRKKILEVIPVDNFKMDPSLQRRIQTSIDKNELEDLYAPYKPPSKGSISERIQKEHPELVAAIDKLWAGDGDHDSSSGTTIHAKSLKPREAVVHLLGTKIAGEPRVIDAVMDALIRHCRLSTKKNKSSKKDSSNQKSQQNTKYRHYEDFSHPLVHLRDHQVLAIRRGVDQKVLKLSYDIDGDKMESMIQRILFNDVLPKSLAISWRREHAWRELTTEVIHDAWTRLLRRKTTTRLWTQKGKIAEDRAMQVFEDNLRNALLAPPFPTSVYILALDPGYQAGIKCAILDPSGHVEELSTVQFLGKKRQDALQKLGNLLSKVHKFAPDQKKVVVALGNGHGTHESRTLVQEAADAQEIAVNIQLVNEAGASVWSVSEAASQEFPNFPPAAIAAASIGRRLQNPLHELVKVPPKSLGLGMYQHDMAEKKLDEKLLLASVDAVATVGVDVNTCSLEILQKVPGLNNKLASKVLKARPLTTRKELLSVTGLGPKIYENCAAFVRIEGKEEELDSTLVHPESYDLAKWLLKKFKWKLHQKIDELPPKKEWENQWGDVLTKASSKFGISRERVLAVVENLVDSMIKIDPRLKTATAKEATTSSKAGLTDKCSLLSPDLAEASILRKACPFRGVIGTIRNIADFGAFIDYGGHNDGLLHRTKLGPSIRLDNLLIGQEIGVDILSVDENEKVSLGLAGLDLEPETKRSRVSTKTTVKGQTKNSSKRRMSTSSRAKSTKRRKT